MVKPPVSLNSVNHPLFNEKKTQIFAKRSDITGKEMMGNKRRRPRYGLTPFIPRGLFSAFLI